MSAERFLAAFDDCADRLATGEWDMEDCRRAYPDWVDVLGVMLPFVTDLHSKAAAARDLSLDDVAALPDRAQFVALLTTLPQFEENEAEEVATSALSQLLDRLADLVCPGEGHAGEECSC